MHIKVITNKNGSILGKIPVRMSETPRPEANRDAEARANYRSSWWPSGHMDPIALVDETRNRARARVVEVEDIDSEEMERPTRQGFYPAPQMSIPRPFSPVVTWLAIRVYKLG
ncbi:hypothetical protein Daesc_000137 [Daldinia eschscholtzii]|uniref:Uncharacterized protein n=1 Tax=Daldinia eschscholtzii TaxID=292717 RepID=A0AAX6MY50_9PEZI